MLKSNFNKTFVKRSIICYVLIMALILLSILRVAVIMSGDYYAVAENQSMYRIEISKIRGTIYDCNMIPLTNQTSKNMVVIMPTPQNIIRISSILEGEQLQKALDDLKNNIPVVCEMDSSLNKGQFISTAVYKHTNKFLSACHTVGYVDASGHGVCGLEKAYDHLLYSDKKVSAVFAADGKGNVLEGIEPYFDNDLSMVSSGVISTLDSKIQSVTETALSKISSGCAIVAELKSGKIRAMASVPTFNINNIAKSLNDSNSPMLNRAFCTYSVGSVFKPLIAAVAIENGVDSHTVRCTGSMHITDRIFRCHKLDGHGNVNMQTALTESCNCYFYDLAIRLKGESIYNMASSLSINSAVRIADNMFTAMGNMPHSKLLNSDSALANIGIGQGSLVASPVTMLNLYMAIAGDGSYYLPSIVEGTVKNGEIDYYDCGNKTRVMSSDTAAKIRKYLKCVVSEGTGTDAAPKYCTAAGKTATAQTGRYDKNGAEITNSWFCGFFPSDEPRYVIIVMSDSAQKVSTASVFAQIADEIMEYNVKNS